MSDDHTPECPQCGGHAEPLGALGSLMHYRCRQCGWTFSEPAQAEPVPVPAPTRGRAKTTGRFETREELEAAVLMYCRRQSIAQVARTCRVSETVVRGVLTSNGC